MQLKEGVRIQGMRPEILFAVIVADGLWKENRQELVVTSVMEGSHSRGSLHYAGQAVDLRIKGIDSATPRERLGKELQARLGQDFDVVLESDHIHVEYQPKESY